MDCTSALLHNARLFTPAIATSLHFIFFTSTSIHLCTPLSRGWGCQQWLLFFITTSIHPSTRMRMSAEALVTFLIDAQIRLFWWLWMPVIDMQTTSLGRLPALVAAVVAVLDDMLDAKVLLDGMVSSIFDAGHS